MISLGDRSADGWIPPVLKTVASSGEGIGALVTAIDEHGAWLARSGELQSRRLKRASDEIQAIALGTVRSRLTRGDNGAALNEAALAVADGRGDAYSAAAELVERLLSQT